MGAIIICIDLVQSFIYKMFLRVDGVERWVITENIKCGCYHQKPTVWRRRKIDLTGVSDPHVSQSYIQSCWLGGIYKVLSTFVSLHLCVRRSCQKNNKCFIQSWGVTVWRIHSSHVRACSVAKSCLTLCDPMVCSTPGSSDRGILQAKILEWVTISFSRRSSWPRDRTCISCISKWTLYHWATWEAEIMYSLFLHIKKEIP